MRMSLFAALSAAALLAVPSAAHAVKRSTVVGAGAGAVAGGAVAGPAGAVAGGVVGGYAGSRYHRHRRAVRHR
ncbi:hypothetical protein [Alsobacter sp. SYSU BS001988]